MKGLFLISIAFLFIFSCAQERTEPEDYKYDLAVLPKDIQQKVKNIQYLDSTVFARAGSSINAISKESFYKIKSSEQNILAEKFCKNSKGYQKGSWEGQNDCSWAIEMTRLEKYAEWVTRADDLLVINLKNGKTIEFVHDTSNPDQILYFQFKNYLQEIGFFVVEAIQKGKCRVSHLINANDGTTYPIHGVAYFSKDQVDFLSATFNKELPLKCSNKFGLYKISNDQIEKMWHIPTGYWGITEVRFINQTEFLLEQSTSGIPSEYKRYARVAAIQ